MTWLVSALCFWAVCPTTDGDAAASWRYPAADRIIALGDVHGDLDATRRALRLAGLIDQADGWIGGATVLVQTGDQLDRGDDEREIIDLLSALAGPAAAAGGAVIVLNGNHELMNAALDFRYVTDDGFRDFAQTPVADPADPRLADLPPERRGRAAAFMPGGPYALRLAERHTIAMVGDTVFVHGGVLPDLVRYGIGTFNNDVRAWLRGERDRPEQVRGPASPVWSRHYSKDVDADACALLAETLDLLGARRMVVSHTVQDHINAACDARVWRIDVGMAAHYGGTPAVLELTTDGVHVLSEAP